MIKKYSDKIGIELYNYIKEFIISNKIDRTNLLL